MTIRRTATWMWSLDDRILEALSEDSWTTAESLAVRRGIHATTAQVQERCEVLADADLVTFLTEDADLVGLTTEGQQYLDGELDVELYPPPRHPRCFESRTARSRSK